MRARTIRAGLVPCILLLLVAGAMPAIAHKPVPYYDDPYNANQDWMQTGGRASRTRR